MSLPELNERYRAVELLGIGGMGAVYKAVNLETSGEVAVKVLGSAGLHSDTARRRLKREVQLAASLASDHWVRVWDLQETVDGAPFIVMELLRGRSLSKLLDKDGALAPARVQELLSQLLSALRAAHSRGIVHRDLKPDNIFVDEGPRSERLKVLDLGIAKQAGGGQSAALTGAGDLLGTPSYMAPEQFQTAEVTPAMDLYAVGVIGYQMLTGALPFVSHDVRALAVKHVYEDVPPPCRDGQALSGPLCDFLLCLLEKEPAARYRSAADALEALDGLEQPLVVCSGLHAEPAPAGLQTGRLTDALIEPAPAPRRSVALGVGAAVVAAAVAALVAVAVARSSPADGREPHVDEASGSLAIGSPPPVARDPHLVEPPAAAGAPDTHTAAASDSGLASPPATHDADRGPSDTGTDASLDDGALAWAEIASDPAGAEVFVNGVQVGTAPLRVTWPRTQPTSLLLTTAHHIPAARSLDTADIGRSIRVVLSPLPSPPSEPLPPEATEVQRTGPEPKEPAAKKPKTKHRRRSHRQKYR